MEKVLSANGNSVFSNRELSDFISLCSSGLYFISAPSGSGKTKLIRDIARVNSDCIIMSCEEFTETVISAGLPDIIGRLSHHKYICIEDIDLRGGLYFTEHRFANIFRRLSKNSVVIITGIDLQKHMPTLFSTVNEYRLFEYFANNYFELKR